VFDQVLNVLPLLVTMPVKLLAIQLIEALGSHSISVGSLKRLLRSLQSSRGYAIALLTFDIQRTQRN
jgi:hypothetical protein